jgi:hypothetical protein
MFRPGQAPRRQTPFAFSSSLVAASFLGLRTKSRLLLNLRHIPCNLIICIACSLPGNRRARRGFYRVSWAISGGLAILFHIGFGRIYHQVPATWSGPNGRSYIMSSFPTLSRSVLSAHPPVTALAAAAFIPLAIAPPKPEFIGFQVIQLRSIKTFVIRKIR